MMQQYDEDSDHSVNGWIKKEPEDEEDMEEEYLKHRQDSDPGDHYEDLMSLNKEELVGRILQQEEDIRYLQDIRNGLEKTVQELQNIVKDLSSITSSFKDYHASTSHDTAPPVSSSTRLENTARGNETSPRVTHSGNTNANISLASPKSVPASRNNTRLTETSSQSYSSIVPAKERSAAASHSSTVTIVKQTNVVIKTEIPSPPPEPEIIENPMQMSPMANFPRKRKLEPQQPFQTHPQVQNIQARQQPQRAKQKPMSIPQQLQQPRPRMNAVRQAAVRAPPQTQNQMPQQAVPNVRMPNPRFPQNPRMQARGRGVQEFQGQVQRMPRAASTAAVLGRPRLSSVKITPVPTQTNTPSNSPVTNVLAEIGAKLPKSLSLSLVQPGLSAAPKTADSGSRSMTIKPADSGDNRPVTSNSSSSFPASNVPKVAGKVVTSNAITSSTTSSSDQGKIIHFGDDDDDENDYDEIAVLEPDKKSAVFDEEGDKDPHAKKARTSEANKESYSSNWNTQNNPMDQSNPGGNMYPNNDEYLLDEPLDDTDLEESDPSAVYLGEDVTLSKEVLQTIIKEAGNHEQLIKNLMTVLFPDLNQLAAESNIEPNKSYTLLPGSKVNAIIELCRKRFPFKNKHDIFGVINTKFQEARNIGRNSRTRMQYTKQY